MVLKGNLLYNGDFETGTTEGWVNGAFGLDSDFIFSSSSFIKYRGSYAGNLLSQAGGDVSYVAYNKTCSFEEHEAYLYIVYINNVSAYACAGMLYGLDDKGNLIDKFLLGYNQELGVWRKFIAILRGFADITHFQVGVYALSDGGGQSVYFDEAKLIPLRSIKSHTLAEYRETLNLTSDLSWFAGLACVGHCKLRSFIRVDNVSGSSPTLDIVLNVILLGSMEDYYTISHSQFTTEGKEEIAYDLPEASLIVIHYLLGGTNPSFDIYHHLRIEPY